MNDPTSEDILKKTFDYLNEVLEEDSHRDNNGTAERTTEEDEGSRSKTNASSETARNDCCSG